MAQENLEKIVGIPHTNTVKIDENLTGTIKNAVLCFNNYQKTSDFVYFVIDKSNIKVRNTMVNACELKRNIEVYGDYNPDNKTISISNIKVKYN
jgi:hypothetical protein